MVLPDLCIPGTNTPADERFTMATTSPMKNRECSIEAGAGCEPHEPHRARFCISYPPNIKGGGKVDLGTYQ